MVITVELDIVIDEGESTSQVAGRMANGGGRSLDYEIVEDAGPTGWPTVNFTGPRDQVEAMLEEHGFEDGVETYEVAP